MERLIESVRKYPCLWKLESEEYKLNGLKEAAWREVIKECNLSDVKEARALWKKLRDGHRQALFKKKPFFGPAVAKPLWKYEKQMEFLLPSMQHRQRATNHNIVSSQDVVQHEINTTENEAHSNEEFCDCITSHPYGDLVSLKENAAKDSVLDNDQTKREERSSGDDTREETFLSYKDSTAKPDSAIENFYKSMLLTTQTLPERLQVRVQRQVFNIVMEAKEEYLATQPSNSADTVATFRSDPPFILPIVSPSLSASSLSNHSIQYTTPPQSRSHIE